MAQFVKKTVVSETNDSTPMVVTETQTTPSQTLEYLVYFAFGVLEILLLFRLVLKLLGASTASGFVRFVYGLSGVFIMPFEGIFRRAVTNGIETASILEPATIVAIIVCAILCWGVLYLMRVLMGQEPDA